MTLKVGIARAAAANGTPNYTQDFTDSGAGFSTDVKAAIFISGNTTADHTTTANRMCNFAFAANNGKTAASSKISVDAAVVANNVGASGRYHNDVTAASGGYAFSIPPGSYGSSGEFQAPVDFSSVSNGVRVTWTDQSSSELIYAILLGGAIEASVVHAKFSTNTSVDVTHELSGTPEVIICIYGNASGSATNVTRQTLGMWDGTTQQCVEWQDSISGNSPQCRIDTNNIATQRTGGGTTDFTLSAVGATQFTVGSSVSTSDYISFLCLRGTTLPIEAKCGIHTLPTSTGNSSLGLSLGTAPQVLLSLLTVATAVDTLYSDDGADQAGAIVALNQSGTTKYGGVSTFVDQGATPNTVAKTQTTNSQAIRLWDTTPTIDVEATVSSWDTNDITLNFSNISSAYKVPYLAFGIQSVTKYLKLLAHSSAASATSVAGVVFSAPTGGAITGTTRYGEFTGKTFEATLESGKAVLKVPVADFGGSALTTSDTPVALVRNTTKTTGIISCTVIEE